MCRATDDSHTSFYFSMYDNLQSKCYYPSIRGEGSLGAVVRGWMEQGRRVSTLTIHSLMVYTRCVSTPGERWVGDRGMVCERRVILGPMSPLQLQNYLFFSFDRVKL